MNRWRCNILAHFTKKTVIYSFEHIPSPPVVYPLPYGQSFLNWIVPENGQISQVIPHPLPPLQQHSDLVTEFWFEDPSWHIVCNTSVKQYPSRLSVTNTIIHLLIFVFGHFPTCMLLYVICFAAKNGKFHNMMVCTLRAGSHWA